MSPSVYIRKRKTSRGYRYHVRYRPGGREEREQHDSVWDNRKRAEERRRVILDALAAGSDIPRIFTEETPESPVTVGDALTDYQASRIDVSQGRQRTFQQVARRLGALTTIDVTKVTPRDVRDWITRLVDAGLARQTISMHLIVLRHVFDHAGVTPNPAGHRSIRLPARPQGDGVPQIPSTGEWHRILETVTPRHRLTLMLLEGTGLRIGEAITVTWGDVDLVSNRILVRGTKTRAATRWVPLTPDLATEITRSCPHEDRHPDRPLIPDGNQNTIRGALRRACRDAGVVTRSPHDLRHRYISMLVAAGTPVTIIKPIVGHVKGATTIDVYSHVLVDEHPERLATLREAAVRVVSGAAPVRPGTATTHEGDNEVPANHDIRARMGDTGLVSDDPR